MLQSPPFAVGQLTAPEALYVVQLLDMWLYRYISVLGIFALACGLSMAGISMSNFSVNMKEITDATCS